MNENRRSRNRLYLVAGVLALMSLLAVLFIAPVASAEVSNQGLIVAQATPGAATPVATTAPAAPTRAANPQPQTGPATTTAPGTVTTTTTDNSWLLWVILGIIVLAALAGGAWYYPRRASVVRRTETEYIDDGGPRPEF